MPYEVYVHTRKSAAYIHDSRCRFLRQHGGVSVSNPPAGKYSGVIETLEKAWVVARAANKRETRTCTVCIGNRNPIDPAA